MRSQSFARLGNVVGFLAALLVSGGLVSGGLVVGESAVGEMVAGESAVGGEPIDVVASEPQLFVDDFLIASSNGLVRTLHQPRKDQGGNEPVIELADEFGVYTGTLEANGTIVFDPRLNKYVMFALGFSAQNRDWDRGRLYRFT